MFLFLAKNTVVSLFFAHDYNRSNLDSRGIVLLVVGRAWFAVQLRYACRPRLSLYSSGVIGTVRSDTVFVGMVLPGCHAIPVSLPIA